MTEGSLGQGLAPEMLTTFTIAFGAMVLMFTALLMLRLRMERQSRRIDAATAQRLDDSDQLLEAHS